MFTIQQIQAAHSKVKSGADFPAYISDIKTLGVLSYETFVTDGHSDYRGANGYTTSSPVKYAPVPIAGVANTEQFIHDLKEHQQGRTSYLEFIAACARFGIEKWIVLLDQMTCTYYDKLGNEVLVEAIPQL